MTVDVQYFDALHRQKPVGVHVVSVSYSSQQLFDWLIDWLTGPDVDVCLSRVGRCQRTSSKHAAIFYDQVWITLRLGMHICLSSFVYLLSPENCSMHLQAQCRRCYGQYVTAAITASSGSCQRHHIREVQRNHSVSATSCCSTTVSKWVVIYSLLGSIIYHW